MQMPFPESASKIQPNTLSYGHPNVVVVINASVHHIAIIAMMMDDGFHTHTQRGRVNHLAFLKIKKCKITSAWEDSRGGRMYFNDNLHGCLHKSHGKIKRG